MRDLSAPGPTSTVPPTLVQKGALVVSGGGASFADLLKYLRQQAGLTQTQLAGLAGVSERSVSDLERGKTRRPYSGTTHMLADALALTGEQRARFLRAAQRGGQPAPPLGQAALLTPLIGRQPELAQVRRLLGNPEVRLVTLCGTGGIGKTRLALEIAAHDAWRFQDGACFIDLAPVSEPALLLDAIAQQVIPAGSVEPEAFPELVSYLKPRQMLLVLDNLEHVLAAAPDLAGLLAHCPAVTILATSRAPLRLRAERQIAVPPLPVPALPPSLGPPDLATLGQNEAVRLFVDRATAHSGFTLQPENAPDVVEICRRLDGLPLAIELAAARTALLPPAAIVARLTRSLSLLVGGARDLPPRHQTLRNAIAWSYRLLSADEQRVFRALAVFAGGATLPLVHEVCCPEVDEFLTLEHVTALANWGLLRREPAGEALPRVRMLETIRAFAADQLLAAGEVPDTQRAHARAYLALAEELEPRLLGANQAQSFAALDAEQENIRAALTWAVAEAEAGVEAEREAPASAGDSLPAAELALRLANAMWWYWETRGHFAEGQQWLERALGPHHSAETRLRGQARWRAGALAYRRRDLDGADAQLHQALAVLQAHDDVEGSAWCQAFLGLLALVRHEPAAARAWHEGALAAARQTGDRVVEAGSLSNLGEVAHAEGDLAEAVRFYTASLAVARTLPDALIAARVETNLALVEAERQNWPQAFAGHQDALRQYWLVGESRGVASSLEGMAAALARCGDAGTAVRLYGAAAALRQRTGAPLGVVERATHEAGVHTAAARLTESGFTAAWAAGSVSDPGQIVADALRLGQLGAEAAR